MGFLHLLGPHHICARKCMMPLALTTMATLFQSMHFVCGFSLFPLVLLLRCFQVWYCCRFTDVVVWCDLPVLHLTSTGAVSVRTQSICNARPSNRHHECSSPSPICSK